MFKLVTVAALSTLAAAGLVYVGALPPVGVAVVAVLALVVVLLESTHRRASGTGATTYAQEDRDVARHLDDLRALGLTSGGAPSRYPAIRTM